MPPTEVEPRTDTGEEPGAPGPVTPWSHPPDQQRPRPGGAPGQSGSPSPGSEQPSSSEPGRSAPVQPNSAGEHGLSNPPREGPSGQATAPGQSGAAPGSSGQGGAPGDGTAAPGGVVSPQTQRVLPSADQEPPTVDPELVADVAPVAATAGAMALAMLPMIASALAGLGGGSGGSAPVASDSAGESGLSPEAAKALDVLKQLEGVYGDADPTDPRAEQLPRQSALSSGSGAGARSIRAEQLFQQNAAEAFNDVDHQLTSYMRGLAGANKVDKTEISGLVRQANTALAELGSQAFTRAGRQKAHQILTAALQKAHAIVSGGQHTTSDIAVAINRLTNQYLGDIAGKNSTRSASTAGISDG